MRNASTRTGSGKLDIGRTTAPGQSLTVQVTGDNGDGVPCGVAYQLIGKLLDLKLPTGQTGRAVLVNTDGFLQGSGQTPF